MKKELQTRQIASFALRTTYDDIGTENIDQLKRHFLDALGSLIYASTKPTVKKLFRQIQTMGDGGRC